MIIINCPRFFSATWRLIKGWLDARTADKVEVISGRGAGEKRLLEFVPENVLPSDYGGKGHESSKIIMENLHGGMTRQMTELMHVRGHGSASVEVKAGEALEIHGYTRSLAGATFSVTAADHSKKKGAHEYVKAVEVKHNTDDELKPPTCVQVTSSRVVGPAHLKVKLDSHGGRFSSERFLVAFSFFPK